MERNFTFGIIGAADIAKKFCKAVDMVEGAEVVAVASRTPGKAEAFAKENNVPSAYFGYEEMLSRPDIDAVYVATTHNFHKENMLLAIEYGKHILCEKTFTMSKADAEEIFAKAKEKGLFVMEAIWSLFNPVIRTAKEWLASGKLGQVKLGHYIMGFNAGDAVEGRFLNPKLGGGAMFDLGIYIVEILTYLIPQKIVDVQSHIIRGKTGVDTVDCIRLIFEDAVVDTECVLACDVVDHLDIYGTKGRIYIERPHVTAAVDLFDKEGLREKYQRRMENGFEYEIKEVMDCIRAGKLESDIASHAHTLQCAEIFDRCFAQNPPKEL